MIRTNEFEIGEEVDSSSFTSTLVDNIIPIAMAGIGIAWIVDSMRGKKIRTGAALPNPRLVERGTQFANDTWEGAARAGSAVAYGARKTADGLACGLHSVQGGLSNAIQDNPLAVGATALAVGAAVGLIIPTSEKENELFGEARDQLVENAKTYATELASETIQSVQQGLEKVELEESREI